MPGLTRPSTSWTARFRTRMPGTSAGMTAFVVGESGLHSIRMSSLSQNNVAIIGAGPAGLMAAEVLAQGGAGVTVYDAMPSAGRKFLMAGRGGLNLTHSEPLPAFLARYREATPQLDAAIEAFPPERLRAMERGAGAADLRRLQRPGVSARRSRPRRCCARGCGGWTPWACNSRCVTAGPAGTRRAACCFRRPTDPSSSIAGATVLALGGASWPRLGSDAAWAEMLAAKGVDDIAAQARQLRLHRRLVRHLPRPLRRPAAQGRCAVVRPAHACAAKPSITRTGIEGGAIYALSADLREAVIASGRGDPAHRLAARSRNRAIWSRGCRRPRQSSRCRTGCARPRSFRPSASACCRRRRCIRRVVVVAVAGRISPN